jgi:serine/threonine-protein kinase
MSGELDAALVLSDFEIISVAGSGGMGVVYRANQRSLGRVVALKVIRNDISSALDYRGRFLREARLAASVDHPNVVSVYDVGEQDGRLFLSMQWVDGVDLRTLIEREGALDPGRAVVIAEQLAGALDAVHEAGLIHRDVKPANVILRRLADGDHAYLTDFGVAKAPLRGTEDLTQAGSVIGTAGYLAPEQIMGGHADARSDLYAMACVTFELLTGKRPFTGANEMALRWAHANSPRPHASGAWPALGGAFDGVLIQALSVDPDQRYQSGRALAAALRSAHSSGAAASRFDAPTEPHPAAALVEPPPSASARAPTIVEPPPAESARAPTRVAPAPTEIAPVPIPPEPAPVAAARPPSPAEPAPAPAARTPTLAEPPTTEASAAAPEPPTRVLAPDSAAIPRETAQRDDGAGGGRGKRKTLLALAAVAILAIAAGGLAVSGVFSSSSPSRRSQSGGFGGIFAHIGATSPSVTTASTATTGAQTASTTTTTGPLSTQASAAVIVGVLGSYQSAYSNSDVSGLGSLFTETVERHGLAPGGCATVHGKGNVLAQYRSQFAGGRLTYRLVGLTPSGVAFSSPTSAVVHTRYYIPTSNNHGSVTFWLANEAGRWLITKIDATCTPSH